MKTCPKCHGEHSNVAELCPTCAERKRSFENAISGKVPPSASKTSQHSQPASRLPVGAPLAQNTGSQPTSITQPPIPPQLNNLSLDNLNRILAKAAIPNEDKALVGGKLVLRPEFVVLIIPLWFNIITDFLVITDNHIVVATRTLWRGIRDTVAIPHTDIVNIEVSARSKSNFTLTLEPSVIVINLKNGKQVKFITSNNAFASNLLTYSPASANVKPGAEKGKT